MFLTAKIIKKIYDKAIDNYFYALKFVPGSFKIEKIKLSRIFYFQGNLLLKIKYIVFKIKILTALLLCHSFGKDHFMLKHCLDRHKTQELCDKAVDDFLPTLKFILDWFVTNKII